MKPLVFYIDDEAHNLTVFEASLPTDWEIRTFSDPFQALEALETASPHVIVTDQRMPGITGVKYLEVAKKLHPHAVRIIVTGYSDENLVIESVRKAQIFDYITKPWEPQDLEASIKRAIDFYRINEETRQLSGKLLERESLLKDQNRELLSLTENLKSSHQREEHLRRELECWVPPFVLWALTRGDLQFPAKRDIVGITFDIIGSNEIHDVRVQGRPLRSVVIQCFSEAVLRNGGWRESHSGDSAYGHFGLGEEMANPFEAALSAAREFRVNLRSVTQVHSVNVECGIALHYAPNSIYEVHTAQLNTPRGVLVQKSFDTTSLEVDLLHRMEKIVHALPGSNIILSGEFVKNLREVPRNLKPLGAHRFKGASHPIDLHLIASDKVTDEKLNELRASLAGGSQSLPKAA